MSQRHFVDRAHVLFLIIVTAFYLCFARFGVDPQHDGIMLGSARIVGEGGTVHRDAFAMYGPWTTWLQALEYRIGGETLLGMRVGSSLALAVSSWLFLRSFRRIFGVTTAFLSVILWVLAAPFVLGSFDQIPWNSDYVLLLQALVVAVLTRQGDLRIGPISINQFHLVGILLGAMTMSRISVGILTSLFLFAELGICKKWKCLLKAFCGFATIVGLILFILLLQRGIADWWFQFVQFPRLRFLTKAGESGVEGLKAALLTLGIPSVGILLLVHVGLRQVAEAKEHLAFRLLSALAMVVLAALLVFWSPLNELWTAERLFWSLLTIAPVLLLLGSRIQTRYGKRPLGPPGVLMVGAGSLAQLFPLTDYRHLWWAILPILGFLVHPIVPEEKSRPARVLASLLVILPVSIDAVHGIKTRIGHNYISVENFSELRGMLVSREFSKAFSDQFRIVSEFQTEHGPKTVLNICVDGLFSVLGERIDYPDQNFVVWEDLNTATLDRVRTDFVNANEPIIWYCPGAVSSPNVTNRPNVTDVIPPGYRLVDRPVCLEGVGGFDDWPLMSYLAVPNGWPPVRTEIETRERSRCFEMTG